MKNFAAFVVVIALTGGVGQASDPEIVPDPPQVCYPIKVVESVDPLEACPTWRRLALKTSRDSQCPILDPVTWRDETTGSETTGSWTVRHLFAADRPDLEECTTEEEVQIYRASAEYAMGLPPALRPFCLYEYQENRPKILEKLNTELNKLIATESKTNTFQRIDNGCAAVGPAGDSATSDSLGVLPELEPSLPGPTMPWGGLEDFFLGQIGDVEAITLGSDPRRPRVRLSFLDTQPTTDPLDGASSVHGAALSRMAQKITCDEPKSNSTNCTTDIEHRLALPILEFDRMNPKGTIVNLEQGGLSGFIDKLATEVWDAVRAHSSGTPWQRHVLNLSVAWDGELFYGLEEEVFQMPVAVQAMHRALEVASCRGALVVAAAGNSTGGPDEKPGPLLPAGWERRDAPTREECHRLLGLEKLPRASSCSLPEPLVYAAAGVRSDNSPLYNTRLGATPPRVAFGNYAWVEGTPEIKPLTGSSSATTVISSTASAVWYHWPHLTRAELMDLLYRAGEDIGRSAEFYHGSSAPTTRRISVCSALQKACNELGGNCPADCRPPDQPHPKLTKTCGAGSPSIDASKFTQELAAIPVCGSRRIFFDPDNDFPSTPCLTRQYYEKPAWPWRKEAIPQPGQEPCMGCGPIDPNSGARFTSKSHDSELVVWIDPEWLGTLNHAFLDINDISLALGMNDLKADSCFTVTNLSGIMEMATPSSVNADPLPYVTLRFLTEDKRVVSSPVLYGH